ncbi:hypothetical protein XBFFL1_1910010 [Xenorhabdus bovienii str. feltiae Florida]|nr:hypothetical protein XBFFL1_1910010 [Xenorhabdus bovienii str. feltiae Florida]
MAIWLLAMQAKYNEKIPRNFTEDYFVKVDKQALYQDSYVDNHPKNPGVASQYHVPATWVYAIQNVLNPLH